MTDDCGSAVRKKMNADWAPAVVAVALFIILSSGLLFLFPARTSDVSTEPSTSKSSPGKDPLIVDGGPMTRSRAKRVKEAMRLLAQAMVDEISKLTSQGTTFMKNSQAETKWSNVIQLDEIGAKASNHATAWFEGLAVAQQHTEAK